MATTYSRGRLQTSMTEQITTQQITIERLSTTEILVRGPEAVREWREAHRFAVPGAEYSTAYRMNRWDGTWAPGKWCQLVGETWEMVCSIGLLDRLERELQIEPQLIFSTGAEDGLVADYCNATPRVDELRDYQRAALIGALASGWGRVALATNAGKGAVIALLAGYARSHGLNALILCDELSVYDALVGEIKKWGKFPLLKLQAGIKTPPKAGVVLAMVPTLARRLGSKKDKARRREWRDWLAGQSMVLVDEADKALADSYKLILRNACNSWWRVGFSGTFPTDEYGDLQFDELMGPVLSRVRNADLIGLGVSAKPLVELHGFDVTKALQGLRLSWQIRGAARRQAIYERAIVRNQARHAAIAALVRPTTPTVIIVNRVEHGKLLARAIKGAVFLDGSVDVEKRTAALELFRRGLFHVLVVTKILDRGTNRLGVAADVIFASGEGSSTQTLQRLGRGLRRHDGKEFLRLVDIIDRVVVPSTNDAGAVALEAAAEFIHAAGSKRVQLYADEGFEAEVLP